MNKISTVNTWTGVAALAVVFSSLTVMYFLSCKYDKLTPEIMNNNNLLS